MAELVDAHDSKSCGAIHGSSILPPGTKDSKVASPDLFMNPTHQTKLLVVVGPTASGKSDLAVSLALAYNGEVISADSRQVYRGLNIGTGKITVPEMKGVPHHCLDIADPATRFTAMDWKKAAETAIADITSRGKLPIICGGTGFYVSTLINDLGFPDVPADTAEQQALEERSLEELFQELKALDPARAATIDLKNKRRLSRAIMIARAMGQVPPIQQPDKPRYDVLEIGTRWSDEKLRERIKARLESRLRDGLVAEVTKLAEAGLSYERMEELGLEYRYVSEHLQGRLAYIDMVALLEMRIWQYAKRQKTWFRRDEKIHWFTAPWPDETMNQLIATWLQS